MTLDDIKALLPPYDAWALEGQILQTMTAGNTVLQDDAGAEAARFVYAAMVRCGATSRVFTADELEILASAVHKLAIFELYRRSELEATADDKRADARVLLRALLGDCATAATSATEPTRHVGGSVSRPRDIHCPAGVRVLSRWDFYGRRGR
jgi:hypothetical protein